MLNFQPQKKNFKQNSCIYNLRDEITTKTDILFDIKMNCFGF